MLAIKNAPICSIGTLLHNEGVIKKLKEKACIVLAA